MSFNKNDTSLLAIKTLRVLLANIQVKLSYISLLTLFGIHFFKYKNWNSVVSELPTIFI